MALQPSVLWDMRSDLRNDAARELDERVASLEARVRKFGVLPDEVRALEERVTSLAARARPSFEDFHTLDARLSVVDERVKCLGPLSDLSERFGALDERVRRLRDTVSVQEDRVEATAKAQTPLLEDLRVLEERFRRLVSAPEEINSLKDRVDALTRDRSGVFQEPSQWCFPGVSRSDLFENPLGALEARVRSMAEHASQSKHREMHVTATLEEFSSRMAHSDQRLETMDARLAGTLQRLAQVEARVDRSRSGQHAIAEGDKPDRETLSSESDSGTDEWNVHLATNHANPESKESYRGVSLASPEVSTRLRSNTSKTSRFTTIGFALGATSVNEASPHETEPCKPPWIEALSLVANTTSPESAQIAHAESPVLEPDVSRSSTRSANRETIGRSASHSVVSTIRWLPS